jgi:hypothetical protein
MSRFRLIRPVDAVSINSGRSNFWQITVPNLVSVFRERDSLEFTFASLVEQAQFDFGRVGREEGEVCTFAVPRCAARMRQTLLNHAFSRFPHRIIFSLRFLSGFKIRSFLIAAPAPSGIEVATRICTRLLSSFLYFWRARELKSLNHLEPQRNFEPGMALWRGWMSRKPRGSAYFGLSVLRI